MAEQRSVILTKLAAMLSPEDTSPEAHFLRTCEMAGEENENLRNLAGELDLTRIEVLAVAMAAAVETDPIFGRAVAHIQRPVGGSRPTIGLLSAAFADLEPNGDVASTLLSGAAMESGLLQLLNENVPLAEKVIAVPVPICLALLRGSDARNSMAWPGTTRENGDTAAIPLPASIVAEAKKHAKAIAAGAQRALVLRSGSPAEARAVAAEIATFLGRSAVFVENAADGKPPRQLPGFAAWLTLCRCLPVFSFEFGPGERRLLAELPRYKGPQIAACGPEGTLELRGETIPSWTLPIPSRSERTKLWEASVGSGTIARKLAGHRHGSGRIAQLGRLARYESRLDGRDRVQMQDIAAASWTTEGAGLEALAQPLTHRTPDDALVTTSGLRSDLHRLLLRCRSREGLGTGLGVSTATRYHPGVRALFSGPSGTGKTLAAGWLATHLGLPLYRVDLASVTSKYIGETEKNLAQLLARAEHAEVVLLFDEADSMFGKRTDVKDSNDRFANAQTNYLLQRIESFDGIVLLTSNSQARFDPAFFRRLDAVVEFPAPGPAERRSLWQSHLGNAHVLNPRELNQLAASADLFGGNIRNAVLTAAVLAHHENRPIGFRDVLQGLSDEYRKLGRQLPADLGKAAVPAPAPAATA